MMETGSLLAHIWGNTLLALSLFYFYRNLMDVTSRHSSNHHGPTHAGRQHAPSHVLLNTPTTTAPLSRGTKCHTIKGDTPSSPHSTPSMLQYSRLRRWFIHLRLSTFVPTAPRPKARLPLVLWGPTTLLGIIRHPVSVCLTVSGPTVGAYNVRAIM